MLESAISLCNIALSGTLSLLDNFLDSPRCGQYTCTVPSRPRKLCFTPPSSSPSLISSTLSESTVRRTLQRTPKRRVVRLRIKSSSRGVAGRPEANQQQGPSATAWDPSLASSASLSTASPCLGYITMSSTSSRRLKRRRSSTRSAGRSPLKLETIPEEEEEPEQPSNKYLHWEARAVEFKLHHAANLNLARG